MPNDKWQTPDIAGLLDERESQGQTVGGASVSHQGFSFVGGHSARGMDEIELGEDQYIIDPDYMEMMGLQWEDLIKYKK